MIKAYNVMSKGVVSVLASTPIQEAANKMLEKKVSSLVVEKGGKNVGIVTDRDFVKIIAGKEAKKDVGSVMSSPLVKVSFDTELSDVLNTMAEHRIKHLIVEENGKPIGVITLRDILSSAPEFILSYVMEKLTDFDMPSFR
ncbi:MAG: CBS domain-containing protein [Candidatus Hydrothermarchaeales archaeon]